MRRKIHKMLLVGICITILSGCKRKDNDMKPTIGEKEVIEKINVDYQKSLEERERIIVTIDLKNGTTETDLEHKEEDKKSYGRTEELDSFIRQKLFQQNKKSKKKLKGDKDDMHVLWRLQIYTQKDVYTFSGFDQEGYPEWWEEFLEYLE